jgi:hypothetical protein
VVTSAGKRPGCWAGINRRGTFRVIGRYLVAAWLIVQSADIEPEGALPRLVEAHAAIRLALILVFPIVLVFGCART